MPQRAPDVVPEIVQRDLTEAQLQAYLAGQAPTPDFLRGYCEARQLFHQRQAKRERLETIV